MHIYATYEFEHVCHPILASGTRSAPKSAFSRPVWILGGAAAAATEHSINSDIKSPECLCIPILALTAQIFYMWEHSWQQTVFQMEEIKVAEETIILAQS